MRVVSVNVGLPRQVEWHGKKVLTSIFKAPVEGRVRVTSLNLDGDRQSDLSVHGGVDKAVYVYPAEHYAFWRREFPGMDMPWGTFGENLTVEGLFEGEVGIGDRFRVGSAILAATQPRMPCFKLGIRFGRPDVLKRFLVSRRTGFYFAVREPGEVGAGDAIEREKREADALNITDVVDLYTAEEADPELLRRASEATALPESWRDYFRKRLAEA